MDTGVPIPDRLVCPITGHTFTPHTYRVQQIQQHLFLWVWCPCCDSSHRVASDPDFDATSPQIHCIELNDQGKQGLSARAVGETASDDPPVAQ